jgi:hypothetical protein
MPQIRISIAPVAGSLLLGQSFLSRFKSWSMDDQGRMLAKRTRVFETL